MVPTLVIAGTHSGVGKTTVTTGLIAAWRAQGLVVQPFKVGPDYIDPTYHQLAAGRPGRTLDAWMVPPGRLPALVTQAARGADVVVVEGVMGAYDGFGYDDELGSTAHVAKVLGAPVVVVLDARAMARSAGAVALGYCTFDPELDVAGFIVNRVAGEAHGRGVAQAVEAATGLPVFGWIPRNEALHVPERHLGLVPTAEPGRWAHFVRAAAGAIAHHVDLERLLATARRAALPTSAPLPELEPVAGEPVVAVARDEAFSFLYPDNLDLLRAAGARLAFFSPLRDQTLPPGTSAVVLSGGFPEVYAKELSANTAMREAIRGACEHGLPVYAECGGLMYLTEAIVDVEGKRHPMAGVLPGHSVMTGRLTLGYRLAEAVHTGWLFRGGERVRGHEFHYSAWEDRPATLPPAYWLLPRDHQGTPHPEGAHVRNVWASYVHLHFWTKPELARRLVAAAARSSGR
ncbi:MAG: cobyrinate a,c-diamide synthase [Ardenticatenia bacterium]|nr:cobyrinate a,c-diamide synthase [Ardenticatenia bacterium]